MLAPRTGFSAIDMPVCWRILASGGGFNELAAFIVLVCHTKGTGKNAHTYSTAGARAISNKTGLSYRKAQKTLDWLFDNDFVESVKKDPEKPRAQQIRWIVVNNNELLVYIPHSLVHGVDNSPLPLAQIYSESELGPDKRVKTARTDTLWLLLNLYGQQFMEDFGGIDPSAVWINWEEVAEDEYAEQFHSGDMTFTPFTPGEASTTNEFVTQCFGEFSEDILKRFWHSLVQLGTLGLTYEVIQCWDSDPREYQDAEILFPLHVFDQYATDPFISNAVNKVVRLHFDYPDQLIYFRDDGKRLFFCPSLEDTPIVLGSYRLRFRPSTQDTGVGLKVQQSMTKGWNDLLSASYEREVEYISD